jgi:hypothetical protein
MRPRLYRHHLVGFVGIVVGHFHFGFGPGSERANLISSNHGPRFTISLKRSTQKSSAIHKLGRVCRGNSLANAPMLRFI